MTHAVLTGGGTMGHVSGLLALVPSLVSEGYDISYIGTGGIEKEVVQDIPFYEISSGKLNRYMCRDNLKTPFLVMKGFIEAYRHLQEIKPDVVVSKGGYVTLPVVAAAGLQGIPVISLELNTTMGLSNRLGLPFSTYVCTAFPDTEGVPRKKERVAGMAVRDELRYGDRDSGLRYMGFNGEKPVLTVIGGSLGSRFINSLVRESLPGLLEVFDVFHITGKGNHVQEDFPGSSANNPGYAAQKYVGEELKDVYASTSVLVGRAGANTVAEALHLGIPSVFMPLETGTRGEQVENARYLSDNGLGTVLREYQADPGTFIESVLSTYQRREEIADAIDRIDLGDPVARIMDAITSLRPDRATYGSSTGSRLQALQNNSIY